MLCKLCNKERKLVKAHIIPECFFRLLRSDDGRSSVAVTNTDNLPHKRAPIGIYDKNLLCEECERLFSDWDSYGCKLFIKQISEFKELKDGNYIAAYTLEEFDYDRLMLFFISLLWRASVSTHLFYERVNLGLYEGLTKEIILNQCLDLGDEISVCLSRFISVKGLDKLTKTSHSPFKERWEGTNAYRFYLGDITAYIKVDKRKWPTKLAKCAIDKGRPLFVVCRKLEGSNDLNALIATVKNKNNG